MEKFAPSYVGKGGFAQAMRLGGFLGLCGGFLYFYQRSTRTFPLDKELAPLGKRYFADIPFCAVRFYGFTENTREVEMDMREMVDKVKRGESLYGESRLTPYMQGVAARQSRYSVMFTAMIPWFNFVNHPQHGVDTAKYYQQAERELEAGRLGKSQS